jgi:hypothetical protein
VHFIFTRRHARHALALLTGQIQPQYQAARVLPSFRGPMHVPVHGEVSEEVDQEDSPRGGSARGASSVLDWGRRPNAASSCRSSPEVYRRLKRGLNAGGSYAISQNAKSPAGEFRFAGIIYDRRERAFSYLRTHTSGWRPRSPRRAMLT